MGQEQFDEDYLKSLSLMQLLQQNDTTPDWLNGLGGIGTKGSDPSWWGETAIPPDTYTLGPGELVGNPWTQARKAADAQRAKAAGPSLIGLTRSDVESIGKQSQHMRPSLSNPL